LRSAQTHAFNYVLDDVLEGGVNSSLGLDGTRAVVPLLDISEIAPKNRRSVSWRKSD
jgi:hypothetical protein